MSFLLRLSPTVLRRKLHCLTQHKIISSPFILNEVEDKLFNKFHFPRSKVEDLIRFLREQTEVVDPVELPRRICRDEDDDMVLGTALAARAGCIITGDGDLLDLQQYEGIPIIKVAEFWKFETDSAV